MTMAPRPPASPGGGGKNQSEDYLKRIANAAEADLGVVQRFVNMAQKWTGTELLPQLERLGATFSLAYHETFDLSRKISDKFEKASIPASVYDAFVFNLHANRLGLKANVESQGRLFKSILATGENWASLQRGLFKVVAGTKQQDRSMGFLSNVLEDTARTFHRSRTELVEALGAVERDLVNLTIAAGGNADEIAATVITLRGLLPDQALFAQAVKNLQKQFTLEGLTESIVMGFPTDAFLRGQGDTVDMLAAMLDQGSIADNMLQTQGRDTIFQLQALRGGFGDLGAKLAVRDQILKSAMKMGIKTASLTNEELAQAIHKGMAKESESNQKFTNTLEMFHKQILKPVIQSAAEFALRYKQFFVPDGDGAKILKAWISRVARTGQVLMEAALMTMSRVAGFFVKGGEDKNSLMSKLGILIDEWGVEGLAFAAMIEAAENSPKQLDANVNTARNTAKLVEEEANLNQKTRQLLNATRKRDIFEIRQTRGLIREFENLRSAVREGTGRTTDAVKKIDIPSPGGRGSDVRSRMP
jgi:hypothetical protein